jgi:hypothetical protein
MLYKRLNPLINPNYRVARDCDPFQVLAERNLQLLERSIFVTTQLPFLVP